VKVLIAPDSFKGSVTAVEVAHAMSRGWGRVRPADDVIVVPIADGGEGSVEVLALALPTSQRHRAVVRGPGDADLEVDWLLLGDGTAVVELASCCGLPLVRPQDPLGASTAPLGELIAIVIAHPACHRLIVCLGGSASTDGGLGALVALGARALDVDGTPLPPGGGTLSRLVTLDLSTIVSPPAGGVVCLTDVVNPLLGTEGAASVFAPQKGASRDDVSTLEEGLDRLHTVAGGDALQAGAGAAGGTAYGFATCWAAHVESGSAWLARASGLDRALRSADLVMTGEGAFDTQSLGGKAAGNVVAVARARGVATAVVAGSIAPEVAGRADHVVDLTTLAGSVYGAMVYPTHWIEVAAAEVAAVVTDGVPSVTDVQCRPSSRSVGDHIDSPSERLP
jgi:glycerate kinase